MGDPSERKLAHRVSVASQGLRRRQAPAPSGGYCPKGNPSRAGGGAANYDSIVGTVTEIMTSAEPPRFGSTDRTALFGFTVGRFPSFPRCRLIGLRLGFPKCQRFGPDAYCT